MQHQRQMMRARVAKRFARVNGQHGDMNPPQQYPISINPGLWGGPWAKVKDPWSQGGLWMFVVGPTAMYYWFNSYITYKGRMFNTPKRPRWWQRYNSMMDLDDPDFELKLSEMEKEQNEGRLYVGWGGTNVLASYLWEPGDPEPDTRRRMPPAGGHH
jgi:hypothetical protein